jgi:hypothetical protein
LDGNTRIDARISKFARIGAGRGCSCCLWDTKVVLQASIMSKYRLTEEVGSGILQQECKIHWKERVTRKLDFVESKVNFSNKVRC